METMFDTLLQLPLFQGLGQADFTTIIEKVKFHFKKHKRGDVIIKDKDRCEGLVFLLKGRVKVETTSNDNTFKIIEFLNSPCIIEPQSLFGMQIKYNATYTTDEETDILAINKCFVMNNLFDFQIFRINFINLISSRLQASREKIWSTPPVNLEGRIIFFILTHLEKAQGEKILRIKMEDLAHLMRETRLNISKALNSLKEKGLIDLKRKEIIVPQAEKLLEFV